MIFLFFDFCRCIITRIYFLNLNFFQYFDRLFNFSKFIILNTETWFKLRWLGYFLLQTLFLILISKGRFDPWYDCLIWVFKGSLHLSNRAIGSSFFIDHSLHLFLVFFLFFLSFIIMFDDPFWIPQLLYLFRVLSDVIYILVLDLSKV